MTINTMKALSVIELAKLYGMNRQSVYKRIKKGDLSKNSDGKIDFSEAIRVFGEPSHRSSHNVTTVHDETVQKSAEVDILRQQVDMLQKQLELAQEREIFQREQLHAKDNQIYSLQLLLGAPKEKHESEPIAEQPPQPIVETLKVKPALPIKEHVPELKKYSLFGRMVRAIID